MNRKELIAKAKELDERNRQKRSEAFFVNTIAWLTYLGLLRHTHIEPKRVKVTVADALSAGEIEPRIFEIIPAMLIRLPDAIEFTNETIPEDLALVVRGIKARNAKEAFRGVPPEKYLPWLRSPAMEIASRRVNFRRTPRDRKRETTDIGNFLRQGRINMAMTQTQFSQTYGVSLRVIRDLEQGKLTPSVANVNDILAVFGKQLRL